jgi:hypothetical protein
MHVFRETNPTPHFKPMLATNLTTMTTKKGQRREIDENWGWAVVPSFKNGASQFFFVSIQYTALIFNYDRGSTVACKCDEGCKRLPTASLGCERRVSSSCRRRLSTWQGEESLHIMPTFPFQCDEVGEHLLLC